MLSAAGQIYRLSPYSDQPVPVLTLGDAFGRCAFVIREVSASLDSDVIDAWLVTASSSEVKAVSLISGRSRTLATAANGETILANSVEEYSGLDADSSRVCFLRKSGGTVSLVVVEFRTGEVRSYDLPVENVVGPFRCGDLIFAYSDSQLFSLGPSGLSRRPFPRRFQAWINPEARDVRPSPGRLPFLVCRRSVYIPGTHVGRAAFLLQQAKGGAGESVIVSLPEEATYRQDLLGRPLLCGPGRVALLVEAAMQEVAVDAYINPRRAAFSSGDLTAAFVETSGGERLRFFAMKGVTCDYPLSRLPHFFECVEFCGIGNSLLMVYLTDSGQTEVVVWHA